VLDGPWATLIVRELLTGPKRFTELRAAHRPVPCSCASLTGAVLDIGDETRVAGWHVPVIHLVGEYEDRYTLVVVALPCFPALIRVLRTTVIVGSRASPGWIQAQWAVTGSPVGAGRRLRRPPLSPHGP
jgi:hypothetical protein